jgi:hypothetical protein
MFWGVPGYLMPTTVSTSTVQKCHKTMHCRVNRQVCAAQGELLLQTSLTGKLRDLIHCRGREICSISIMQVWNRRRNTALVKNGFIATV